MSLKGSSELETRAMVIICKNQCPHMRKYIIRLHHNTSVWLHVASMRNLTAENTQHSN